MEIKLDWKASTQPPMQTQSRISNLKKQMQEINCPALIVTNLANIFYLTGFSGSAAMLGIFEDEVVFVTDGRYRFQSEQELHEASVKARIEIGGPKLQLETLAKAAKSQKVIGLEADHISWSLYDKLQKEVFPDSNLIPTSQLVERLRKKKDSGELWRISQACQIADKALKQVSPMLFQGISELDFASALDYQMRSFGASAIAFDTIVAAGPNGAKPHAKPTERIIEPGELIVIDFGATYMGYRSDMTRTLCIGEPKDPMLKKMFEVVQDSQNAGLQAVRPGIEAQDVDKASRDVIAEAGWEKAFMHSTGHGVGIDIHEAPGVSQNCTDILESGFVITVEPGVYLENLGGVRIEDTVVVTDQGFEFLTQYPKELIIQS